MEQTARRRVDTVRTTCPAPPTRDCVLKAAKVLGGETIVCKVSDHCLSGKVVSLLVTNYLMIILSRES